MPSFILPSVTAILGHGIYNLSIIQYYYTPERLGPSLHFFFRSRALYLDCLHPKVTKSEDYLLMNQLQQTRLENVISVSAINVGIWIMGLKCTNRNRIRVDFFDQPYHFVLTLILSSPILYICAHPWCRHSKQQQILFFNKNIAFEVFRYKNFSINVSPSFQAVYLTCSYIRTFRAR